MQRPIYKQGGILLVRNIDLHCLISQTLASCSISGETGFTRTVKRAWHVHTFGIDVTVR